ncbi:hypothetical protein ACWKWU_20105 [Chitinophaga lutea]
MKKLLLLLSFAGLAVSVSAQSVLDQASKATKAAQSSGFDVKGLTSSILGQLTPSLGLTEAQKPGVTSAISGFLKDKSGIMGLQNTDKAAYASKFSGLQSGLFGKLKTLLTVSQYTKFLGLKPKSNVATNALSQLFF